MVRMIPEPSFNLAPSSTYGRRHLICLSFYYPQLPAETAAS